MNYLKVLNFDIKAENYLQNTEISGIPIMYLEVILVIFWFNINEYFSSDFNVCWSNYLGCLLVCCMPF